MSDTTPTPGLDDLTAPQRARVAALTFARQLAGTTAALTGRATTCEINDMLRAARFILTGDEFHDAPTDDDLTPDEEPEPEDLWAHISLVPDSTGARTWRVTRNADPEAPTAGEELDGGSTREITPAGTNYFAWNDQCHPFLARAGWTVAAGDWWNASPDELWNTARVTRLT